MVILRKRNNHTCFVSNFFLERLLGQNTNDTGNKMRKCNCKFGEKGDEEISYKKIKYWIMF